MNLNVQPKSGKQVIAMVTGASLLGYNPLP